MTAQPGLAQDALYGCTNTATVGVKGLMVMYKLILSCKAIRSIKPTATDADRKLWFTKYVDN